MAIYRQRAAIITILQISTQLIHDDKICKVPFAQICHEKCSTDNEFLRQIVFCNEYHFYRPETENKHNLGIWRTERTDIVHEVPQSARSVHVFCRVAR